MTKAVLYSWHKNNCKDSVLQRHPTDDNFVCATCGKLVHDDSRTINLFSNKTDLQIVTKLVTTNKPAPTIKISDVTEKSTNLLNLHHNIFLIIT